MWRDANTPVERLRSGSEADWRQMQAADPSFPRGADRLGRSWVMLAISAGSPACVNWMIEQGVDLEVREAGATVLEVAIERAGDRAEKYAILTALIAAGAELDDFGTNGWTPLHVAAARNDLEAITMLLKAGAHRHLRTLIDDHETALDVALAHGHEEAARLLREK